MHAPLREQRDLAKLQLAAFPAKREEPGVDEIDAEAFRAAVLEAWTSRWRSAARRSPNCCGR